VQLNQELNMPFSFHFFFLDSRLGKECINTAAVLANSPYQTVCLYWLREMHSSSAAAFV